jgi:NDP-sugar pyrophosphorylase family protein
MKAMLFAAGLGTRLKPFTDNHPKALAQVNGKTLLEHNICYLQQHGVTEVVVNVHHFADQIEAVLAQNNGFGSKVHVSDERDEVLETGGGLLKAAHFFDGEPHFVVMNVDILTNLNLAQLLEAHITSKSIATLAVMERQSSRNLLFNSNLQLCGWQNNSTGERKISIEQENYLPFAFSGVQIVTPQLLTSISRQGKFSMIDAYLDAAKHQSILGFNHTGDILIDVGKPESLAQAAQMFS